ncbi:MAG: sensor histidine kinase [Eubacteriales bacterium]
MIYRLQRKFILISVVSVFAVIILMFSLMTAFSISSMNNTLDLLADKVSAGGGNFPDLFGNNKVPKPNKTYEPRDNGYITPETRFSTRYFTVFFDSEGEVQNTNTESIFSVTEETAVEYAKSVINKNRTRGWISNYRYNIYNTDFGKTVVFIDGSTNLASLYQSVIISAVVLFGCAFLVLVLITLLSKRVVKPIAESYEKQKQFITDANHELKTPLTLILANLDIAEAELGKNEWLDDIRIEGKRMTELVNQLVALSRMDENEQKLDAIQIQLSDIVADTVSDFSVLASEKEKELSADIEPSITCMGDETLIRRLLSILLDNALKYCDTGGEITVSLKRRHHVVLTVENTYKDIDNVELDRLFDRFYRADKARTFTGGYGVGLSIAKSIAEKHRGEITAYKKGSTHIGFKVVMKQ